MGAKSSPLDLRARARRSQKWKKPGALIRRTGLTFCSSLFLDVSYVMMWFRLLLLHQNGHEHYGCHC